MLDYIRLGPAIREARRSRNLTQIRLKDQLGCSQSQISELELGIPDAVSRSLLERIAEYLEVNLGDFEQDEPTASANDHSFCANQFRPIAIPTLLGGQPFLKPHFVTPSSRVNKCKWCGEALVSCCQACNFPVEPDSFCRRCGKPCAYVKSPGTMTVEAAEEKARQLVEYLRQLEDI